jgi:branched-chain amino acid transport system permease protein
MEYHILLQQILNGISLGGVYALEAVGFGIIFNILKFSNFSHSGVVAITAYLGFFISKYVYTNFLVTLILTTLAGGFIGVMIEKLIFRPIRLKGAPLTLFLVNSITAAMLVQQFFAATLGDDYYPYPVFMKQTSINLGTLTISKTYTLMLIISGLILLLLTLVLKRTNRHCPASRFNRCSNTQFNGSEYRFCYFSSLFYRRDSGRDHRISSRNDLLG